MSMNERPVGEIRVIHVDDEPDFAALAADFLEREAAELSVTTETSAGAALDRLQTEHFDCVVSDYQMPGTDGLEFLETVREDRALEIPFIIFTGKGREDVAIEALNLGADRYLQKGGDPRAQFGVLAQAIDQEVEHHRTQRDLERAADIYGDLFDESGLGLLVFDPETSAVLDCNRAARQMTGQTDRDLTGRGPGELFAGEEPYTADQAREHFQEALEADSTQFIWRSSPSDGTPAWQSVVFKMASIQGEERVVAVIRDITELKERERQMELFRTLIDHATDSIFVIDEDTGAFIDVNDTATDLLGYDRETLLGMKVPDMSVTFDDTDEYLEYMRREEPADPDPVRDRHIRADGSTFPVEVNATVVNLGGRSYRVAIARDISRRQEREEALSELHEAAREMETAESETAVFDQLIETGKTVLEFDLVAVDVAEGDELVQKSFSRNVGSEEYYETVSLEEDTFATRAYNRQETIVVDDLREAEITPADPEYRSALTVPIGSYGTFQTVSRSVGEFDEDDRELAELLVGHAKEKLALLEGKRELEAQAEELERQNERLSEFASIVSHDLRTPLTTARGHLELVADECDLENIDTIAVALDQMESLIEDTLEMARGSQMVTEIEPVEVGPLLDRCWQGIPSDDARLDLQDAFVVGADEDRLQQVFENLLRNAVQHGGEGVTIRVGPIDGTGFYVADDGEGLTEAEREQVFERGFSTAEAGTGYGMAIVAEIAEAHGWDVAATESESGGARFEITGADVR